MLERIVTFAKFHNLPIFRWPLPAYGKEEKNLQTVQNLHSEDIKYSTSKIVSLYGYYVQDLPVKITHNASLEGRIVNGTTGTLYSIRPTDIVEVENKVKSAKDLDPNNSVAGTIIDISTPECVYIDCPTAEECFRNGNVCFLSDAGDNIKRRDKVVYLKRPVSRTVLVVDAGYVSALGGTGYAFQGKTIPYVIFDLNYSKGNPITLAYFNLCISRVKDSLNCFVMPLIDEDERKKFLYRLRHEDIWYIWDAAYDDEGIFQVSRLQPISKLTKPYEPSVNAPGRSKPKSKTGQSSLTKVQPTSSKKMTTTKRTDISEPSEATTVANAVSVFTPTTTSLVSSPATMGIENIGNTCYLAVVVQGFFPPLYFCC